MRYAASARQIGIGAANLAAASIMASSLDAEEALLDEWLATARLRAYSWDGPLGDAPPPEYAAAASSRLLQGLEQVFAM